jgi:hypothetical protein
MTWTDQLHQLRAEADESEARLKREYGEGMIRLGIWYVRWLLAAGQVAERNVADALTRRVNIYRLLTLWDGIHDPACGVREREWDCLVEHLAFLVRRLPLDQVSELEELALSELRPWLRVAPEPAEQKSPFGCWTYEVVGESMTDGPGLLGRLTNCRKITERLRRLIGLATPERHAALHFFNACAPRSPFGDVRGLASSLRAMIRDCRHCHPTVQTLWCQSWLNSKPSFLALFPETWRTSSVIRTTEDTDRRSCGRACLNTHNWWGQFMRSNGGFHERRAQLFRSSGGQFPYPNRLCHAGLDEIDAFSADLLNKAPGSRRETCVMNVEALSASAMHTPLSHATARVTAQATP